MKTAVIIPAFNEEDRIGWVLQSVCCAPGVDEIIVVVDGSDDDTAAIASEFQGVKVLRLAQNLGKGGALSVGVRHTDADVLLFVDADLVGLRPEHLTAVLGPVLTGRFDMCIGVFSDGTFWSDTAQKMSPEYSGQRALKRSIFEAVNHADQMRFGIEIGLNHAAKLLGAKVGRVALTGVTHCHKEMKWGIVRGAAARARMYAEMGRAYVKVHQQHKKDHARTRH